jgi:tRNA threonylcarbamoyladenosine biosynthesis protein TsaE
MIISIGELESFGKKTSHLLKQGCPLLLYGDLGVGKTTFARSMIRAMCPYIEHIQSPSFPLMLPYETTRGTLWHCDLYRISHPSEIEPLGLRELMATSLCLIEWPERLGHFMPPSSWSATLSFTDHATKREIVFEPPNGLEQVTMGVGCETVLRNPMSKK